MRLQVESSAFAVCSCVSSPVPASTTLSRPPLTSDSSSTQAAQPTLTSWASPASVASFVSCSNIGPWHIRLSCLCCGVEPYSHVCSHEFGYFGYLGEADPQQHRVDHF